ncbi:MAG: hypothetical protein FJX74_17485 [Armatimonadetes bacterium]|nr:hypothetical protein [Armatimonadota bacterium]
MWRLLAGCALAMATLANAQPVTLHVSPDGSDAWSGRTATANAAKTDGPLASLIGARDAIRKMRAGGALARVVVQGGVYRMDEPLVLEPQDSFVTYEAAEGARPVFSGGIVLTDWTKGEGNEWTARRPEGLGFRQLFVNGERRTRARTPNAPPIMAHTTRLGEAATTEGFFLVAGKAPPVIRATGEERSRESSAFVYEPGSIQEWDDLREVEVVVYHSWETSRLRILEVEALNEIVSFTGKAAWPFLNWGADQRYYVENAPDALDAPGEWRLDTRAQVVRYLALPGEDMTQAEVIVPRLTRLVELRGDGEIGLPVEAVTLRGLAFHHQDWTLEPEGHSDAQAVWSIPAAVMADGALNCTIENCEIAHVGEYGVWFRRGCKGNRFVHNRVRDLGVGGVRIGETVRAADDALESSGNLIDNNHVYDGGHVYAGGVGIWVAQSSHNTVSHNEIHDFNYSGMSIGWNWGDEPNRCRDNVIEHNHVHHVMRGQLNDGGAIYTLGTSPGSVIRNNVFHDVWPYSAIGWGIYLDGTCNQYLVEDNIVYNVLAGGLMYHNGGHEHVIRNNVFAYSAQDGLWPFWEPRPNTFERNIVYFTQGNAIWPPAIDSFRARLAAGESFGVWDRNLYWNPNEPEVRFFAYGFDKWRSFGLDVNSVIADPQFVDAEQYDFALRSTSPALKLGFRPIDTREVGLYGEAEWVNEPQRFTYPRTELPPAVASWKPQPVDEGFETIAAGGQPSSVVVSGEGQGASIRVSEEQAAEGRRSLKITDAPGLAQVWEPHLFYQPRFTEGVARASFDLYLEPDALMFTEWRDATPYPDNIGPSVTFDAQGAEGAVRVQVGGATVATIPVEAWVRVEIECALGEDPNRTFTLTLTRAGEAPERLAGLPLRGGAFGELQWLGFVSTAETPVSYFLDNVRIHPAE